MIIHKVPSKSEAFTFREVREVQNVDGSISYECSCPANVWYRMSKGRHGKAECSHIKIINDVKMRGGEQT